jgi:serine protease
MKFHYATRLLAALPLAWATHVAGLVLEGDAQAVGTQQIAVKLKADAAAASPAARVAAWAAATGSRLVYQRTMAIGALVLGVPGALPDADVDALAARIAAQPGVDYAERSRRVYPLRVPNDPYFPGQFYLQGGNTTVDAVGAWDLTTGSPAVVVAVLDTGVTIHSDLAGRVIPGYDMVNNPGTGNDGDTRDPDASDPGDWVNAEDLAGAFAGSECPIRSSSWHGTGVMGVIGAAGDNGKAVTGVDWNARLMPVRVLGKCSGSEVDVADAIAWAGGLSVPKLPDSPNPAQVINMSLGGAGPCPRFAQESINKVLAHGITRAIVAAGGNDASAGPHSPSACDGVIAVAATAFNGDRASYSNFGPRIDLAAPGGDAVGGSPYNFLVISNQGKTVPTTEAIKYVAGTSVAAPLVSGVAALMLAVAPGLSAVELRERLKASTRAFPAGSTCITAGCGAGILDAQSAVRAALATTGVFPPISVVEYYNANLDHYFITWADAEIALLDAGTTLKGWTRTQRTFKAFTSANAGTTALCRIYIPPGKGDGHYFGRDQVECDGTIGKNPDFVLESPNFFYLHPASAGACAIGTVPVYRVFSNRVDANHRYTTDRAVRDAMVAKGWLAEGDGPDTVVMCAPA